FQASGFSAYQTRVWPNRRRPWARAKAAIMSGRSKFSERSGCRMYSIFISHSGVSWETCVATRAAKSGACRSSACTAAPTGNGATDLSGGTITGVWLLARRAQAARARDEARRARLECPSPLAGEGVDAVDG